MGLTMTVVQGVRSQVVVLGEPDVAVLAGATGAGRDARDLIFGTPEQLGWWRTLAPAEARAALTPLVEGVELTAVADEALRRLQRFIRVGRGQADVWIGVG